MLVNGQNYRTVWMKNGVVYMINQLLLPYKFEIYECKSYAETANAIKYMVVRGAGAIGAAAGFAMTQAWLAGEDLNKAADVIKATRPTAQNLFYAVDKVKNSRNKEEAITNGYSIADHDADACKRIGELGEPLIGYCNGVLTHCNAGWLAFVDYGSALSPIYLANRKKKVFHVYVDETRPRRQGALLTSWELLNEKVPHTIISDTAAGYFMKKGLIHMVITGADRIASNGDTANKIGTYQLAVLAKENNIPFYIAAPTTTIDFGIDDGSKIPIEERSQEEVLCVYGRDDKGEMHKIRTAPEGVEAKNPAFDVTPAKYITSIITEKGIFKAGKIHKLKD